ncbi:MBOAT, membrane-bound O-acyltransferase family-domain-containing protein [Phlyctochytrium arcticum]|nr:MBOAT, membrane-bound O-acyltransferase family-domain-containing protein [Phlyctochytrium arcticum]
MSEAPSPTYDNIPLLPNSSGSATRKDASSVRSSREKSSPPRWKTLEFLGYYAVIAVGLTMMFQCAWVLSDENHPNFSMYKHRLRTGWMLNRRVDNSDAQYASFRNNIPLLIKVAIGYLALSHIAQRIAPATRMPFALLFSTVFLSIIHGTSVLKLFAITGVNFVVSNYVGRKASVVFSWLWSLGILFANFKFDGYKFGAISESLEWMDQYNGINMRWWITFNFSILRMISYTMDHYWQTQGARDKRSHETCKECSAAVHPGEQCARARIETPHSSSTYNILNYYTYLFYVPLYLAGPIITFNDFMAQMRYPPKSVTLKETIVYAIRWGLTVLCMEWMLHTIYVVAIKDAHAWVGFTPFQISMVGYFNLKLIWLKLLIIWRFFRLWAMADRIDVVENMTRCMSNNYSAIEFWKSWHRSFNRWLVRYLYVPLGGSKYYAFNIFPIFTFVAIWHDISLRLLMWGWLVSLFILPEFLVRKFLGTTAWKRKLGDTGFRLAKACAGVLNMLMMMVANLVGFAVGVDGVKEMIHGIFYVKGGAIYVFSALFAMFSTVQLMFEIRQEEHRRGIKK